MFTRADLEERQNANLLLIISTLTTTPTDGHHTLSIAASWFWYGFLAPMPFTLTTL